jgi:4-amino-4-deoxy-L-arabinose transferase-like glycosyltransferase
MDLPASQHAQQRAPIPAWAWALLAAVFAVRFVLLTTTPIQLYPDEAQYWGWAQNPAFGYYSKPPLVAWLIASTTALFGDDEWAVRLSALLCHTGAAAALMLLGRDLYGKTAGLLTGALWLTAPAVALSSMIVSTDAPLMLCWSVMLLALFRLAATRSWAWAGVLGAAIGLGLLAKYAMLYGLIALALAALVDVRTRRAVLSRQGALAALVCAALVAPNLVWNAMNGMATIAHTADNADWSGSLIHPGEMIEFWIAQLGVFGLAAFPLMIAAIVLGFRGMLGRDGAVLAAFATAPLVIVSAQAFLAHAYANWAFAAYPAGAVLSAGLLTSSQAGARLRRGGVALILGVGLATSVGFAAMLLSQRLVDAVGLANAFKQTRAWNQTSDAILDAAAEVGFDTILFDDRFAFHAVDYYGRERPRREELTMWRRYEAPSGHAETCCALKSGAAGPVLLVSHFPPYDPWFAADFARVEPVGEIVVDLGGGIERRLRLFAASGYEPVTPRASDAPPD